MRLIVVITLFITTTHFTLAQGCSDAGFCTMGAMKPDQDYSKKVDFKLRSLELNYYHGQSTLSPVITVYTVDLAIGLNDYNSIQIKVPYQTVSGNLGDTRGLGDISLSASRSIPLDNNATLGLTLGAKIPSGRSDLENTNTEHGPGGDLPMYYQVSLGTYDAVAGASYITEKWLLAAGIQIPVIHQNENDFRWGQWPEYPDENYLEDNHLANYMRRGTDVMLRVERNFRFLNYNFSFGLLPIYRITRDQRWDFNTDADGVYNEGTDDLFKIDNTTGLALSALTSAGYHFNVNNSVKAIFGLKLADRDMNPDGLTRKHVLSFSYVYRF